MAKPEKTFLLWIQLYRWVDGDSVAAVIDQGFYTYRGRTEKPVTCRAALINAPELSTGQPGLDAKAYAELIAPLGEYQCISYRPDEYGRPLIDLMLSGGFLFSEAMMAAGHAVPFKR